MVHFQCVQSHLSSCTHFMDTILAMPLVYCLLTHKDEVTYRYVLQILKQQTHASFGRQLSPRQFTSDIELAMITAIAEEFDDVEAHGCSFHFGQALFRHIGQWIVIIVWPKSIMVISLIMDLKEIKHRVMLIENFVFLNEF